MHSTGMPTPEQSDAAIKAKGLEGCTADEGIYEYAGSAEDICLM